MEKSIKISCLMVSLLLSIISCAQTEADKGYRIDARIKGLKDTTIAMGYYYGESTYLSDSARIDGEGKFRLEGAEKLPEGVYFLALDKTRLFDLVMGDNQHFAFTTSADDYIKDMVIKGSEDNRLLFANMLFNAARHKEAEPFVKIFEDSTAGLEQKEAARAELVKIDEKVLQYQDKLIAEHPTTVTARWLKATQQVLLPEDVIANLPDSAQSGARYRYYRKHFFDNVNLADDAMMRLPTPLYSDMITNYLDRLVPALPDSVMSAVNELVEVAEVNPETYKYLVWNVLMHYQQPKLMGLDQVYVDLYDTYFASGKMDFWISDAIKEDIQKHADRLRLSLIGNTAPNLIMQDEALQLRSLYDLKNRYVMVFFFDPDCGHCKTETPKLVDFYEKYKDQFDVEVYAVSSDSSMQKMKDYTKDMNMPWITVNGPRTAVGSYNKLYDVPSTPTLYILDADRKIIAKKPPLDVLVNFFEYHERLRKQKENPDKGSAL